MFLSGFLNFTAEIQFSVFDVGLNQDVWHQKKQLNFGIEIELQNWKWK